MARFLASWGSLDICHRDSGHSAVLLQVAPTDRIRDTTQNTDVRRSKHPCTFLRVFVRRIWVEAWLEICLRPAGSNEARSIMSNVKSVLPFCTATQTFCGKRLRSWDWSVNHPHAKVAGRFLYLVPCRPCRQYMAAKEKNNTSSYIRDTRLARGTRTSDQTERNLLAPRNLMRTLGEKSP